MGEVLLVVYDYGSLPPTRLKTAADANGCDLVYVLADTAHAHAMRPVLEATGSVIDTAGVSEADLRERLGKCRPAGIVTFSEFQISWTAHLAELLDLQYQATADLPAIVDKDAQRARLAAHGVDTVRHHTVRTPADIDAALAHVGLPAIVKPVRGASSRNTFLVDDEAEIRREIEDLLRPRPDGSPPPESSIVVEEYLVGRPTAAPWGDYIAVDCAARDGQVRAVFVTSKFALSPPFRERGGYGSRSIVSDQEVDEVCRLACAAVHALGIRHGIADVEIKLTESGPRIIEMNGRLGAWVDDLAVRSGTADPADIAVKAALGRDFAFPADPGGTTSERIAFQYLLIPPRHASRVRAVRAASDLRRLEHVSGAVLTARPGQAINHEVGTASFVGTVLGTAATHGQLAEIISRIEDGNWVTYD